MPPEVTLTTSGTYYVVVSNYYTYEGEYRFRVTLADPSLPLESGSNNSTTNAVTPSALARLTCVC